MKTSNGFTLAEIMVVIAIVALVGTMLVAIFISTLRGSNKAQVLASIKQNGQAVLDNLDKTIRGADNVVCVSESDTLAIVKNGLYTRFRFIAPTESKNGMIQQDNPVQPTPPAQISDFIINLCADEDLLVNPITLTDTNPESGVSVESGSFNRIPAAGYKDIVSVAFTLAPAIKAPPVLAGQIDPVAFQTTITLR